MVGAGWVRAGWHRARQRKNCAAFALLLGLASPLAAQDITLTSRDGALSVSGTFTSYDGEFFRMLSDFGPLTINAASVICDGPACPDLTAPKAIVRITGDGEAGAALLPGLLSAFARARGYDLRPPSAPGAATLLLAPRSDKGLPETVLAEIVFTPRAPEAARAALADGLADLVVARFVPLDSAATLLAQDALVPIVAPSNPTARLSTADLGDVLAGKRTNWADVGGPDMPIVLHGLADGSDLTAALTARLGAAPAGAVMHANMAELAAAVARDPWGLAMTGLAQIGPARVLPLADSCGFALEPSAMAVISEDYPLTLPVYLLTPPRRLPLMTRELIEFLALPAAQSAISQAGFVASAPIQRPLANDGLRLLNAVKAASAPADLPQLQRLAFAMETHDRLSLTFRFDEGSRDLDLRSSAALSELAQRLAAGQWAGRVLSLVGFVPDSGNDDADQAEAQALAKLVRAQLPNLAPDLPDSTWPQVEGFGAALPLACDSTPAGKRLNRRVELWVQQAP